MLILQMLSLSPDTQAAPSGGQEGQSNGPFYLGRLGQLGLQDLPHTEPGGDGRGRRHHSAQTAVHQRYLRKNRFHLSMSNTCYTASYYHDY